MPLAAENEITPIELKDQKQNLFLLDVRELSENKFCNINEDLLIPLGDLPKRWHEIPKDRPIVVYCRSGGRSEEAVKFLLSQGFHDVKNLLGGILRWSQDVDASIPKY